MNLESSKSEVTISELVKISDKRENMHDVYEVNNKIDKLCNTCDLRLINTTTENGE